MKKIIYVGLLVSVIGLSSGVALAATKTVQEPVKFTEKQQTCINDNLRVSMKSAQDIFNAATKDALKIRQDAMKPAQDALNAATKDALKTRQDAIKAAQKIKSTSARAAAIKAAYDAYNNDATVKQAMVPYTAAMKIINDAFNSNNSVKQARVPYEKALKVFRAAAVKSCTSVSFIGTLNNMFQKSAAALMNAFTFFK